MAPPPLLPPLSPFLFSQPLALCELVPGQRLIVNPALGRKVWAAGGASALSQLFPMKETLLLYELGLTFTRRSSGVFHTHAGARGGFGVDSVAAGGIRVRLLCLWLEVYGFSAVFHPHV